MISTLASTLSPAFAHLSDAQLIELDKSLIAQHSAMYAKMDADDSIDYTSEFNALERRMFLVDDELCARGL